MKKISFLLTSESMKKIVEKNISETIDTEENIEFKVELTDMKNCLEKAKELIKDGTKIIITKIAVKLKIEDEIDIPIISMGNTLSDYVEFLKDIDLEKNKIVFADYIEPSSSFFDLIKILPKKISFEFFDTQEKCKKIVEDCVKNKVDIIVGGSLIKKYAGNKIKVVDLPLAEDSINMYKDIARDVLENIEKESIKEKVFQNIETMVENYLSQENLSLNSNLDLAEDKVEKKDKKVDMNLIEKNKIIDVLKNNSFSVSKTAGILGISRTTLWRKLKKYNIELN